MYPIAPFDIHRMSADFRSTSSPRNSINYDTASVSVRNHFYHHAPSTYYNSAIGPNSGANTQRGYQNNNNSRYQQYDYDYNRY